MASPPPSSPPACGDDAPPGPPPLVCVEYPGVVEDVGAMLCTLGGLDNVAKVYEEPNRRLELRFRPADVFCKPTCGERTRDAAFLLRARRRKRTRRDGTVERKVTANIVGTVDATFRFNNLCDFQYLPVERSEKDGEYRSIYDQVHFAGRLVDSSWLEAEEGAKKKTPLFLPPAAFSRMDQPQDYQYRREAAGEKSSSGAASSSGPAPYNIIGRTRQRRSHHAIFVTFDVDRIPERPREVAVDQVKVKFIGKRQQEEVRRRFEECPIWSKNALLAQCGGTSAVPPLHLKFILPTLAYYFTTGPWRNQWVRFGYDPRKDRAGAAMLQTLDYRVRAAGGARHKVKAKRNYANYLLPYKAMNWSKPRTAVINTDAFSNITPGGGDSSTAAAALSSSSEAVRKRREAEAKEQERAEQEDAYLFRPGRAPPCRQMFYRFKDLLVEEAQRLMAANLKTSAEAECDEKNGWFASGTDAQLREVLNECINRDLDEPAANGEGAGREAAGIGIGGGRKNDEEEESDSTDSDDGLP